MVNVALVLKRTPETPPGVNPDRPESVFLVDPLAAFKSEEEASAAVDSKRGLLEEAGYLVERIESFEV